MFLWNTKPSSRHTVLISYTYDEYFREGRPNLPLQEIEWFVDIYVAYFKKISRRRTKNSKEGKEGEKIVCTPSHHVKYRLYIFKNIKFICKFCARLNGYQRETFYMLSNFTLRLPIIVKRISCYQYFFFIFCRYTVQ